MRESALQRRVMLILRSNGIYCRKIHDSYTAGLPDILCIIKGQAVFFELKSDRGQLSKIQVVEMGKITSAGGKFFLIKTVEELKDALKKVGVAI